MDRRLTRLAVIATMLLAFLAVAGCGDDDDGGDGGGENGPAGNARGRTRARLKDIATRRKAEWTAG